MTSLIVSLSDFGWGRVFASVAVVALFVWVFVAGNKKKGDGNSSSSSNASTTTTTTTPPAAPTSDTTKS